MATPPSPLPNSVPSPSPSPREREYLNTLQDATRTLFARAPQASGLRQQAGLQLTSSTLGSNGQPTPLTDLQLQQQAGAFPEKQPDKSQGGKLDLSRSTLGVSEASSKAVAFGSKFLGLLLEMAIIHITCSASTVRSGCSVSSKSTRSLRNFQKDA
jgi:hypothetical protein